MGLMFLLLQVAMLVESRGWDIFLPYWGFAIAGAQMCMLFGDWHAISSASPIIRLAFIGKASKRLKANVSDSHDLVSHVIDIDVD
jgi:hypothetical protein